MAKSISSKEIAQRIVNKEEIVIVDIRNADAFADWKIEGKNVEIINEPYIHLLDGVDPIAAKLDKEQEVIVACVKGNASQMIADALEETGFTHVYSLEGGMTAWSEHLEPVKVADLTDGGTLYQFVRLGKGCLSYFIESNGEAAIIDPARMTGVYEQFAKERGVQITHLMDTHLHADHISGGRELAEKVGGTYHLPPKDATDVMFAYTPLEEGKDIVVGNTSIHVRPMHAPGHTIGSTSFTVDEKYLLTGDSLFVRSIGRPDLAGKAEDWVEDLRQTLYSRYAKLSEDLIVLPAHYSFAEELGKGGIVSARLGDLYENNQGLQVEDEAEFRKMVTENLPAQPNAYKDIRNINMGQIRPAQEEQTAMEIGPNRCAVEG